MSDTILCGNAGGNVYLTFKGGCREELDIKDSYRCTGCGGRFHKDCILKHFELEKDHDWGRQQEREALKRAQEQNVSGEWVHAVPVPYYPNIMERVFHLFGKHVWVGNNPVHCGVCNKVKNY